MDKHGQEFSFANSGRFVFLFHVLIHTLDHFSLPSCYRRAWLVGVRGHRYRILWNCIITSFSLGIRLLTRIYSTGTILLVLLPFFSIVTHSKVLRAT